MTKIAYFNAGTTVEAYDNQVYNYIKSNKANIEKAANNLGMPNITTAIAGAMAEENHSYVTKSWQPWYDDYALSNLSPETLIFAANTFLLGGWAAAIAVVTFDAADKRSHADWALLYSQVSAEDEITSGFDKFLNPILGDLGPGNVNMRTAIRLITEYRDDADTVGIDVTKYTNDYAALANDLVEDVDGLAAKLYGLMIKEADAWFIAHHAYGEDWATLPQEIKDALYITYTNIGRGGMEARFNESTADGVIPFYEPLPAASSGGGLNHLNNAAGIATAIGTQAYGGDVSFATSPSQWVQAALQDMETGLSTREALYKLRPFAVEDGDYDNADDQLDLYDPAIGQGSMTGNYLQDRADMLAWKMQLRNFGQTPDGNILYKEDWQGIPVYFEDRGSQFWIFLGNGQGKLILFGTGDDDSLQGGLIGDRLYGGGGNDELIGGTGNDYLEGGEGNDTYLFAQGDGFDTILDTDGSGKILLDSLEVKGDATPTNPKDWIKLSDTQWQDRQNHINYGLKLESDGSTTLFITKGNDTLKVAQWASGELGITLGASGLPSEPSHIFNGDQHAPLNDNSHYDWGQTHWSEDGTLVGGIAEAGFNDVITVTDYAGDISDDLKGLGGNDALDGGAGDDKIDGGDGNDLIGGGKGSDSIKGGDGNDMILSAIGLAVPQRARPDEDWQPPEANQTVWIKGSNWGVVDNNDREKTYVVYGGGALTPDDKPDTVLAGKGNDRVVGGLGDDHLDGEEGDDKLSGHGGNDIIIGGGGNDAIDGDGLTKTGFYETLPVENHGNDYLDGGEGDDIVIGGGKNDVLFGGTGKDLL